jgi:hypothetical protein
MKMIFRLLAITFVFVNMAGFAKTSALATLMGRANFKLDASQIEKQIVKTFKNGVKKGVKIVNTSTHVMEIKVCDDDHGCNWIHPYPNEIKNVSKQFFPISSGTIKVKIEGKDLDVQEGVFYKWTGTDLIAIGSMRQWNEAVHALPARRRLLKKH